MWLIVGLGNPGNKYNMTRHNIGFMVIDYLYTQLSAPTAKEDFKAKVCKTKFAGTDVVLCQPLTFMNLSGESVQPLMDFYKIPKENIVVIQDDIDQAFAKIKVHKNRGHGGHNGIKSINERLGSADYIRIKLGVGRPLNPNIPVADYVLQKFSSDEMIQIEDYLSKTLKCIESIIIDGYQKAATKFNT